MTSKGTNGSAFTVNSDTNNRLVGFCYDGNGNQLRQTAGGNRGDPDYTFDLANRMVSAKVSGGNAYYFYDDGNKRIAKMNNSGGITVYIYGAGGEKLSVATGTWTLFGNTTNNVYFAGRLIKQNTDTYTGQGFFRDNNFVAIDRTGSVVSAWVDGANATYLPYGQDVANTPTDQIKFATYTRDSSTGLDYADQRFYTSQFGRFMSADRFIRAASVYDSGSWNKYSYTRGDPVNRVDHRETCDQILDFDSGDGSGGNGCDDDSGGDGSICSSLGLVDAGNGQCVEPQPTSAENDDSSLLAENTGDKSKGLGQLPQYQRALQALTSFSTTKIKCLTDLTAVGLTPDKVDQLAQGVNFISFTNASPQQQAQSLNGGADLATNYTINTIYYVDPNLAKLRFSAALGELLHEVIHLSGFGGPWDRVRTRPLKRLLA